MKTSYKKMAYSYDIVNADTQMLWAEGIKTRSLAREVKKDLKNKLKGFDITLKIVQNTYRLEDKSYTR
jgi:hypothetical protein